MSSTSFSRLTASLLLGLAPLAITAGAHPTHSHSADAKLAPPPSVDITNKKLTNQSPKCDDYSGTYTATAQDMGYVSTLLHGQLHVFITALQCHFSSDGLSTAGVPNHEFDNGSEIFDNKTSPQVLDVAVTRWPSSPPGAGLTLGRYNAIMLNGALVDLLAAACWDTGNDNCTDEGHAWRKDPLHGTDFKMDGHHAHAQQDGTYHYHGDPVALYQRLKGTCPAAGGPPGGISRRAPVIGFAADGYPIYGPWVCAKLDTGKYGVRWAKSSYVVRTGTRPDGPGGTYDGTYRQDYEYDPVKSKGDLDACNGETIDGAYGYHVTAGYPYLMGCFHGTPSDSFNKPPPAAPR